MSSRFFCNEPPLPLPVTACTACRRFVNLNPHSSYCSDCFYYQTAPHEESSPSSSSDSSLEECPSIAERIETHLTWLVTDSPEPLSQPSSISDLYPALTTFPTVKRGEANLLSDIQSLMLTSDLSPILVSVPTSFYKD